MFNQSSDSTGSNDVFNIPDIMFNHSLLIQQGRMISLISTISCLTTVLCYTYYNTQTSQLIERCRLLETTRTRTRKSGLHKIIVIHYCQKIMGTATTLRALQVLQLGKLIAFEMFPILLSSSLRRTSCWSKPNIFFQIWNLIKIR